MLRVYTSQGNLTSTPLASRIWVNSFSSTFPLKLLSALSRISLRAFSAFLAMICFIVYRAAILYNEWNYKNSRSRTHKSYREKKMEVLIDMNSLSFYLQTWSTKWIINRVAAYGDLRLSANISNYLRYLWRWKGQCSWSLWRWQGQCLRSLCHMKTIYSHYEGVTVRACNRHCQTAVRAVERLSSASADCLQSLMALILLLLTHTPVLSSFCLWEFETILNEFLKFFKKIFYQIALSGCVDE